MIVTYTKQSSIYEISSLTASECTNTEICTKIIFYDREGFSFNLQNLKCLVVFVSISVHLNQCLKYLNNCIKCNNCSN